MNRPKLLDAFACQGGATRGYLAAGFDVTAVDMNAGYLAKNPAGLGIKCDAVKYIRTYGHLFDAIHASPPCQRFTHGNAGSAAALKHPDLIAATREACESTGRPYVIENVPRAPLNDPVLLCGTMFGLNATDDDGTTLHLQRHRLFESNVPLTTPAHRHVKGVQWAGAYGGARRDKVEARTVRKGGYVPPSLAVLRELLGIDDELMTEQGLFECIPPRYAQHIGAQLLAHIESERAA